MCLGFGEELRAFPYAELCVGLNLVRDFVSTHMHAILVSCGNQRNWGASQESKFFISSGEYLLNNGVVHSVSTRRKNIVYLHINHDDFCDEIWGWEAPKFSEKIKLHNCSTSVQVWDLRIVYEFLHSSPWSVPPCRFFKDHGCEALESLCLTEKSPKQIKSGRVRDRER